MNKRVLSLRKQLEGLGIRRNMGVMMWVQILV